MVDNQRKVIWCEGMFLQPHHFQQQERYWQNQIHSGHILHQYPWGFTRLVFNRAQLKMGILALNECAGIMPDGTCFDISAQDMIMPALRINEEMSGISVVLALPLSGRHQLESHPETLVEKLVRYRTVELEVRDSITMDGEKVLMQMGELNLCLIPEDQVRDTHSFLPVAQIRDVRPEGEVVLDDNFIPPVMDYRCIPHFAQRIDDFLGRLRLRRAQLQENFRLAGNEGAAGISYFLYLQSVSRAIAVLTHFTQQERIHPELLFRELLALAGEWHVFSPDEQASMPMPAYSHQHLARTFIPLLEELQRILSMAVRPRVIALPLQQEEFGIYRTRIDDMSLFLTARLILAVKADMPANELREEMPARLKVGTGEHIQDMVNLQLPGFPLTLLQTLPNEVPYFDGYQYFELNTERFGNGEMKECSGLAIYVSGEFPGGKLALWAYGEGKG